MIKIAFCSLSFFLLLHLLTQKRFPAQPFYVALKFSRGIASVFLTLIGFYFLFQYFSLWRYGFIVIHERDSLLLSLVYMLMGHFIADFIWLAYGFFFYQSKPRVDLIIHHLFGLIICVYAIYCKVAYAIIAISLTSEMLPITSGINSWASIFKKPRLENLSVVLRLLVLLAWRIPLWLFVFIRLAWEVLGGTARDSILGIYPVAFGTIIFLVMLDTYWSFCCFRAINATRKNSSMSET